MSVSSELYTAEQRARRDQTRWTLVQGVLAPLQFVVFLISVALIFRFLSTGVGEQAATLSILLKTLVLYLIMITGAIWEKRVFGQYLFAHAFFWEDVVSMFVIATHTLYVAALFSGLFASHTLMGIALVAYVLYAVNAAQFLYKFKLARQHGSENGSVIKGSAIQPSGVGDSAIGSLRNQFDG